MTRKHFRRENIEDSVIKREAKNEAALERLLELGSQNEMTEAEAEEFEMLALLVKNYEDKHYKIDTSEVTPLDIIKFRMEQNGLTAKDMTAYLGSPSKVSEVLSGKRPLSLTMIKKLHKGLHISADLLLEV